MVSGERRRSWWGWGWEDEALSPSQVSALGAAVASRLGLSDVSARPAPSLASLDLAPPRVAPPAALAEICSTDVESRAGHTYGKAYRDVVRAFEGRLDHPPDVVARPRDEAEVIDLLDWCADVNAAAVAYGAGSSVVGGVECDVGDWFAGAVSIDLSSLDRVVEVDPVSRAARIQAGARGPVLEDQLHPHGYTLRHFPQSFEFSTLGGWLATRSGGHYATNYTHIDDFVESLRVVTPAGVCASRRLPGSGAGPSPDRLFLGSEGILGIITEAWMRVQDRPTFRASATARFPSLAAGVGTSATGSTEGTAGAWRNAFLRAPYGRDAMVALGCIAETFETACTWDAFDALHREATAAVEKALSRLCGGGVVTCRFTHVYP